ncbi:nose resistant to fluoxetine protein 6 [Drosophila virilis]|nr:nose resistant to fluoxetine protein 6 [Drosophila virilis]
MGNYDECVGINKAISDNYNIQGKYCRAKLTLVAPTTKLQVGICLPASCSAANMNTFLKQLIKKLIGLNINTQFVSEDACRTSDREPFDGLTIFTIVLLSVLGAVAVLATICDYFLFEDQKQLPFLVKAFSIRANSRTLFRLVEPNSNPNVIDCLHGMRCLSLIWVVFGHQYLLVIQAPIMNMLNFYYWVEKPFTNFISHAVFSVDTFLFLSGLLLVVISMRSLERTKGRLNIPLMYLHRYLRLTPIVAVAILIYMKLLPYLGDGPMFNSIHFDDYSRCERTWFWSLLYLQNYATAELCLNHTWYLAVDMQLYILSPIFLLTLYKWGKKAAAGIFVFMLLLSACLFSTMMTNKYPSYLEHGIIGIGQRKLYFATHRHAAPWLIGALFGYFLHVNRHKNFQLSRIMIWLGWLISLTLIFTSIFALHASAQWSAPNLTLLEAASYYTLSRIAWPLALCWVVFACMRGYGGLANSFLSSPMWQPLSKLSYCAYIFHIVIQQTNVGRIRTSIYFSDYDLMLIFWGAFGFTVILSYVMYIIVEAPFGVLETMLMPNRRTPPKANTPVESPDVPPVEATLEAPKTNLATLEEQHMEEHTSSTVAN